MQNARKIFSFRKQRPHACPPDKALACSFVCSVNGCTQFCIIKRNYRSTQKRLYPSARYFLLACFLHFHSKLFSFCISLADMENGEISTRLCFFIFKRKNRSQHVRVHHERYWFLSFGALWNYNNSHFRRRQVLIMFLSFIEALLFSQLFEEKMKVAPFRSQWH